jgi:hypothetical protein
MEKKIAGIVSVILHPVFIPLYCVYFIFRLQIYPFSLFPTDREMYIVLLLITIFNVLIPLIFIFLLKKTGLIQTFQLEQKRERVFPLFIYAMMLYFSAIICRRWNLPPICDLVFLLMAMISLSSLMISFFYKISLHLIGWGTLAGLLIFFINFFGQSHYLIWLSLLIFLSGLISWSRAVLEKHKAGEMITGFVLGCLLMFAGLMVVFF